MTCGCTNDLAVPYSLKKKSLKDYILYTFPRVKHEHVGSLRMTAIFAPLSSGSSFLNLAAPLYSVPLLPWWWSAVPAPCAAVVFTLSAAPLLPPPPLWAAPGAVLLTTASSPARTSPSGPSSSDAPGSLCVCSCDFHQSGQVGRSASGTCMFPATCCLEFPCTRAVRTYSLTPDAQDRLHSSSLQGLPDVCSVASKNSARGRSRRH